MTIHLRSVVILGGSCLLLVMGSYGQAPLQISLVPEAQLVSENEAVRGLRLSLLHGKNTDVDGLDIGVLTEATQNVRAFQIAGLRNDVGNELTGVQIGGLYNHANRFNGMSVAGLFNNYDEEANGLLMVAGICNYGTTVNGLQISLINWTTYSSGLQIGLVNRGRNIRGLQIGAINIIDEGVVSVMPVANMHF